MSDDMRYRIDYRGGDCDLTGSLAKAKRLADSAIGGAVVFDFHSMQSRKDFALSEEDEVYSSEGKSQPEGNIEVAAKHDDPEIDKLYHERRSAALDADSPGGSWGKLEAITRKLAELDPEGDWYFEGYNYDTLRWEVHRR